MPRVRRRTRILFASSILASTVALAAGAGALASAVGGNSVSIEVIPSGQGLGGVSMFQVRVSGVATLARHGLWANQRDVLFVFAGQTKPCAGDIYTNLKLQTAGQGFTYRVGPGAFSVTVSGFADSSWKYGHFCAYLAPLNFGLDDRGGVPLGNVVARADRKINVRRFGAV